MKAVRWLRDTLTWFLLLWQECYLQNAWHTLPAIVPSHFGLNGQPDRHAPRAVAWVLFGIGAFLLILLSVLERFPRLFNLPSPPGDPDRPRQEALARDLLRWVRLETALLFAYILWSVVNVAMYRARGLNTTFMYADIAVVVLTSIYFIRRMKPPENSL